jgi:hypothetical protein
LKLDQDISLTLSGVRALIGEITPALRSASIEFQNNKIVFKCVFDETAIEGDFELVSAAAGEIIADFPNFDLEEIFLKISQPNPIKPLKNILYHRHESNYL